MKRRPGFFHGVIAAAILALSGAAMIALLTPFLGLSTVIRLTALVLSLAYLLYLFKAMRAHTGRIVTLAACAIGAALAWWIVPSTPLYLALLVGGLWLVRSLYAYASLIPATIDLGITALGGLAFVWAVTRTGSVVLATWCFFLVQALWACVPAKLARPDQQSDQEPDNEAFERARRRADSALRELLGPSG